MTRTGALIQFSKARITERRQHLRYPLHLEGECWLLREAEAKKHAFGRTLNISSGGILFETEDGWPLQGEVELLLVWPAYLNQVYPLRLRIRGRIVRNEGRSIAIDMQHYEFCIAENVPPRRAKGRRRSVADARSTSEDVR